MDDKTNGKAKEYGPTFQLYAERILTECQEYSDEDFGIYCRLLFYQWVKESIPKDFKKLSRIVTTSSTKLKKKWKLIGRKFVDHHEEGRLINKRLEIVRQEQIEYRRRMSKAGKKGARSRWGHGSANAEANGKANGKAYGENITLQSPSPSGLDFSKLKSKEKLIKRHFVSIFSQFLNFPGGGHFSNKVGDYFLDIFINCYEIEKLPKKNGHDFNPWQFVQKFVNKSYHPGAINEVLEALIKYWPTIRTGPWNMARGIIDSKNGNWNERDHIKNHEEVKKEFNKMVDTNPNIKALLSGIGKEIT